MEKVFRRISRGPDFTLTADLDYTGPIEPDHIFLEMERFSPTRMPIIVIDEYDRVQDDDCRILMTDVIKGLTYIKEESYDCVGWGRRRYYAVGL